MIGLLVKSLKRGIRGFEVEENMLAHFQYFFNLMQYSHLILRYSVFQESNVSLVISLAFAHQGRRNPPSIGQSLHHLTDVLWTYWPVSGRGGHFFPFHIPYKQLLRVICSLINLSIKLFRQASVCYTLSIAGFVNKENECDLTWKCPEGNNPVLSDGEAGLTCSVFSFLIPILPSTGYWEVL